MNNIYTRVGVKGQPTTWSRHDIVNALVGGEITSGCDINGKWEFTYHSGQTPPTEEEIDAEVARLDKEWSDNEYVRNRQEEYPTIDELTVALYDTDDKAAIETKRAAVKTKWPKDNSGPVE